MERQGWKPDCEIMERRVGTTEHCTADPQKGSSIYTITQSQSTRSTRPQFWNNRALVQQILKRGRAPTRSQNHNLHDLHDHNL
eukprot:1157728-Pelagomonas_calceolata.AAC.7